MHFSAVTQILHCIKDTLDDSIIFQGEPDTGLDPIGYTDADY